MGLNTIRESCNRVPYLINEDDLNFLCTLRTYKEKNVSASARGLINYYRDVNEDMLNKEFKGRDVMRLIEN